MEFASARSGRPIGATSLHRHRELLGGLRNEPAAAAERARGDERDAAARVEAVSTRKAACEQQLEEARAALTAAFANWRAELAELDLDDRAGPPLHWNWRSLAGWRLLH